MKTTEDALKIVTVGSRWLYHGFLPVEITHLVPDDYGVIAHFRYVRNNLQTGSTDVRLLKRPA